MKTKAVGVFFALVMAATAAFAQMGGGMMEGHGGMMPMDKH